MTGYKVVVTRARCPWAPTEKVREVIARHHRQHPFDVVSNPEFLKEGAAIDDFMKPDRVVIGVETSGARGGDGASSTRRSCAPASRSS
jgi:UDPglucose 6-dehydrogenase